MKKQFLLALCTIFYFSSAWGLIYWERNPYLDTGESSYICMTEWNTVGTEISLKTLETVNAIFARRINQALSKHLKSFENDLETRAKSLSFPKISGDHIFYNLQFLLTKEYDAVFPKQSTESPLTKSYSNFGRLLWIFTRITNGFIILNHKIPSSYLTTEERELFFNKIDQLLLAAISPLIELNQKYTLPLEITKSLASLEARLTLGISHPNAELVFPEKLIFKVNSTLDCLNCLPVCAGCLFDLVCEPLLCDPLF